MAKANTRLAGHELPHEGRLYGGYGVGYVGGPGSAMCTCGERSPYLPSANARKKWHRQHKSEVRAAQNKP